MERSPSATKVDIIIVGAGLSGLTCAMKLIEKGPSLRIRILEADEEIGGQIRCTRLGEIGAKWITSDQKNIYKMIKELNIPINRREITYPTLRRCWDIDQGLSSVLAKNEIERYIQELDLCCQYFRPKQSNPYKCAGSMECHINKRLFFNQSRKFVKNLILLISGSEAINILYNDFMTLCFWNGGISSLLNMYLECSDHLIEISSTEMLDECLKRLIQVDLQLKRKVQKIYNLRDSVEVHDSERTIHLADVLVLAIPWNYVEELSITPALPQEVTKCRPAKNLPKHMMTSFLAKYVEPYWQLAGFSGNLLLNEPFFIIGQEYRPKIYSGYIIHKADNQTTIRSIILETLANKFGQDMRRPIEYVQNTYEMNSMDGRALTTPCNRIVWASSSLAGTCYRGRLGGAVQSGLRAAMNALLILRPQTVAWQDVAETQCPSLLTNRKATRWSIWLSSWNVINMSFYGLLLMGTSGVLGFLHNNDFI